MKKSVLRSIVLIGLVGSIGFAMQGCATVKALSGPPPVEVEKVKVGENRSTIISLLGAPRTSDTTLESKTDVYEFVDGFAGGTKARVIVYLAGDFFTLFLSEILFWPIELAMDGGTKGRAVVKYGLDDIAKHVLLTQADGKAWGYVEPEPVIKKTVSRVDPVSGSIIVD